MAHTEGTTASATTTPKDLSRWAYKFNITSFQSDPWRWNKEWEKLLATLSSSKDVYPMMGEMYKKAWWPATELETHAQEFRDRVCKVQNAVANIWGKLQEMDHAATAWLLLAESERQRHLLKGLEGACQYAAWHQDGRALCPEITISSMLKRRGQAFIDFIDAYKKGKDDVNADTPYCLPSEWWSNALEDLPQSLTDSFVESTFTLLTLHRNEFISHFLIHTAMSIVHDFSNGSPGMDPVTDFMQSQGPIANAWGKTLAGVRDKPVIRCEHCTKTPEEIGRDVKFMLCSACKSKLDFPVHYCSQACQKGDWQQHKKHCGKSKVSKKLSGTVHDPFWAFPDMPDHLRHIPDIQDGGISVSSIGFPAPNSQREYSQALQRQLSLINADKEADYFLFDENDCPVRVVLHDMWMKMIFRILRSDILSSSGLNGLGAIAEYLIKVMGQKPGLSRETILSQLEKEYGSDVVPRVADWERKAVENGLQGGTFLESMSRGLMASMPSVMGAGPMGRGSQFT